MPDNEGTLRDILQGFNQMQSRLGLLPGAAQGQGIQPLSTPSVKHPGEVSQEASIRLMQSTQATLQSAQQIRMLQPPSSMAFAPPGSGGDFSQQFRQRMAGIESNYQDPYQAQAMSQQMGQPGFMTLPSPTFMTQPSMGVFRPGFQPPPPIAMARTPPMLPMPFTPQLPSPMFQTPLQMQQAQGQMEANEMFSGAMAGIPAAARIGTGIGGFAGGAMLGRRFGGAFGAAAGAIGGGLLGFGPAGGLAEQGAGAALSPAVSRRAFGLQMQDISRNFVVSGPELAEGGRGLSMRAGIQTGNAMRRAVDDNQTGGFNMRDMMGITSMAGDMGMMDMAQNSEQIVGQAKNIARGLSAFMRLANEPDVRKAMQQMASMRQMGLTVPETTVAMQNAQQFARMAGTTVANLGQTAGMPGAMTFQQSGMTAGLGFQVGMGAGGMARQAVAGGAFTPGQLAMAGGVRGVQQQLTEASSATLGIDFPLMAMLQRNAQGQLAIDPDRARRIARGDVGLSEQAGMAQQNVERLGGANVIMELSTRMNELRDELGRTLGPQGTLLMTFGQARTMQRELGGAPLGAALNAMGMNPQQARTLEQIGSNQGFWRNMHGQTMQELREARHDEALRREQVRDYTSMSSTVSRNVIDPLGRAAGRVGGAVSNAYDAMSQWWGDADETGAARRGGALVRRNAMLRGVGERSQRNIADVARGGGLDRASERFRVAQGRAEAATAGELGGAAFNLGASGVATAINPLAGIAAGVLGELGLSSDAPEQSLTVQAMRAQGGVAGMVADISPSLALGASALAGTGAQHVARGQDAASLGRTMQLARETSRSTVSRLNKEMESTYQTYKRTIGGGKGPKSLTGLNTKISRAILADLRNNASIWRQDRAATTSRAKEIAAKVYRDSGVPANVATRLANESWDQGAGVVIMKQVQEDAAPKERAILAATDEAAGFTPVVAAKTYEDFQENVESALETVRENVGLGSSFFGLFGTSDEAFTAYRDVMTEVKDTDDALMLHARALLTSDDPDVQKKGQEIEDALRTKLKGKYEAVRNRAIDEAADLTDTEKEALRTAGVNIRGRGGIEAMRKAVSETGGAFRGLGAQSVTARGAVSLSDTTGVDAFTKFAGGATSTEDIVREAKDMSPEDLERIRRTSPELAAAFKKAKQGDTAAAKEIQGRLARQGRLADADATEVGGKGTGGAKEGDIIDRAGTIGEFSAAFAESMPVFTKATNTLNAAANTLHKAALIQDENAKRGRW